MSPRSLAQLALVFVGLVIWGYGQRIDSARLTGIGIAFFAAATLLRFFKKRE